jgi:YHS domain-containing protein
MEKDPVCGMMVDPKASRKSEYRGKTYYFCSASCMREFDQNPEKFVGKAEQNNPKTSK